MVEKISYLLLFGWFEHIKKVSLHPAIQKWACSPPLDGDPTISFFFCRPRRSVKWHYQKMITCGKRYLRFDTM